jgi:hypothetical protein
MKRSNVKKRLDKNDIDTKVVIERIDEMGLWRE